MLVFLSCWPVGISREMCLQDDYLFKPLFKSDYCCSSFIWDVFYLANFDDCRSILQSYLKTCGTSNTRTKYIKTKTLHVYKCICFFIWPILLKVLEDLLYLHLRFVNVISVILTFISHTIKMNKHVYSYLLFCIIPTWMIMFSVLWT